MRRVGTVQSSFFVREGKDKDHASFSTDVYPLKNSAILDSATTIHIFNEITRFIDFKTADLGDYVWAGEKKVPIKGSGTVDVVIKAPNKDRKLTDRILRIRDVAFCPNFAANLVSLQQLHKRGLWWDNRPGYNHLRRSDFSVVAVLENTTINSCLSTSPKICRKPPFLVVETNTTHGQRERLRPETL